MMATRPHYPTLTARGLIPETRNRLLSAILLALVVFLTPLALGQNFTILHKFSGEGDGAEPPAGVILDANGNLYGVTVFGGSFNYGTVFQLDARGRESLLHSFLGGEGLWPVGGLILAGGNLYGTASNGGTSEGGGCAHGCGTVFKRDQAGNQTVLYAFTGDTDGGVPDAALIQDAAGNLYGTTAEGGDPSCFAGLGCGVVFKIDTSNQESVLYPFTDMVDGQNPDGLVADDAGNLYGTTYSGGTFRHGNIFKLDQTGTLTVLYSFTGGSDSGDPKGPLIRDGAGNLYGITLGVGIGSKPYGIVFKLDTANTLHVLYHFKGGADGSYPSSLVLDETGNLYGTTYDGGTGSGCYYVSCGTVFQLDTNRHKTVLHSFAGSDGELPNGLTMDTAGNLYGTTLGGGKGRECSYYHGCGTVFKLTP